MWNFANTFLWNLWIHLLWVYLLKLWKYISLKLVNTFIVNSFVKILEIHCLWLCVQFSFLSEKISCEFVFSLFSLGKDFLWDCVQFSFLLGKISFEFVFSLVFSSETFLVSLFIEMGNLFIVSLCNETMEYIYCEYVHWNLEK